MMRRALTLVECVVALVIVSVMLVAALNTVGASRLGQFKNGCSLRGQGLAHSLLSDILNLAYEDPQGGSAVFGPETGETFPFDDADDYASWSGQVKDPNGVGLPGLENWTWSVAVDRVDPLDITQVRTTETGLKRITVTVRSAGRPVATAMALKAKL
jgi:prepilin-type N-terminal cleavage/methylation domain-containing protein